MPLATCRLWVEAGLRTAWTRRRRAWPLPARPHVLSRPGASAAQRDPRVSGNHRRGPVVDGSDDLGVIDPAQITGRYCQVGVPELALDHDQRDPFAGHLYRM